MLLVINRGIVAYLTVYSVSDNCRYSRSGEKRVLAHPNPLHAVGCCNSDDDLQQFMISLLTTAIPASNFRSKSYRKKELTHLNSISRPVTAITGHDNVGTCIGNEYKFDP